LTFTKESYVEKKFIKKIKAEGGLALKFISPSMTGVPDRIVNFIKRAHITVWTSMALWNKGLKTWNIWNIFSVLEQQFCSHNKKVFQVFI